MSKDFEIRFLGGVPVDLGWGSVVEEGGWARYGSGKGAEGEDGKEGNGEGINGDDGRARRKGDGEPLVQRYRSCKLSDVFRGITEQVIQIVEGDHEATRT